MAIGEAVGEFQEKVVSGVRSRNLGARIRKEVRQPRWKCDRRDLLGVPPLEIGEEVRFVSDDRATDVGSELHLAEGKLSGGEVVLCVQCLVTQETEDPGTEVVGSTSRDDVDYPCLLPANLRSELVAKHVDLLDRFHRELGPRAIGDACPSAGQFVVQVHAIHIDRLEALIEPEERDRVGASRLRGAPVDMNTRRKRGEVLETTPTDGYLIQDLGIDLGSKLRLIQVHERSFRDHLDRLGGTGQAKFEGQRGHSSLFDPDLGELLRSESSDLRPY